ncbi:hypothetical protein YC2023_054254 [Brassica napus]
MRTTRDQSENGININRQRQSCALPAHEVVIAYEVRDNQTALKSNNLNRDESNFVVGRDSQYKTKSATSPVEGFMTDSTMKVTRDPYIIVKARDV